MMITLGNGKHVLARGGIKAILSKMMSMTQKLKTLTYCGNATYLRKV